MKTNRIRLVIADKFLLAAQSSVVKIFDRE